MKIIPIVLVILVCFSCKQTINKSEDNKQSASISETNTQNNDIQIDSILMGDMIQYMYYNKNNVDKTPNSTKYFYTSSKKCEIFYREHPQGILSKSYYPDGSLYNINFSYDYPQKGDTVSIWYFENGLINSTQTIKNDKQVYPQSYIRYYLNGNKAITGTYDINPSDLSIAPSNLWYVYDSIDGRLKEKTYYHLAEFGKDYKIVTTYNKQGLVVKTKIYNNDVLYETELKELKTIPE